MKKNQVSLKNAISIVIGCVIGSGIFAKPGRVLEATGSSNGAIIAWVLGGLIALVGALTLAEIAARIPKVGGIYAYTEEMYGKPLAFINGWMQAIIYGPALSAGIGLYLSSILIQFAGLDDNLMKPITIGLVVVLTTIISLKMSWGTFIQNIANIGKLIPIFGIIVGGLVWGEFEIFNLTYQSTNSSAAAGMGVAMLATFWAYDGWVQVSNLGDEIENPSKNIPKAFIFGILFIMFTYIIINLAIFKSMPIADIVHLNEKAAAVAANNIFGPWGGKILALGILIGMLGAVNGNIITMPLVSYSMAKDKLFPFSKIIGKVSKNDTPANATIFQSAITILMIIFLDVNRITDIAMFCMYLFYSLVFVGLFKLRYRDGKPQDGKYRVPYIQSCRSLRFLAHFSYAILCLKIIPTTGLEL